MREELGYHQRTIDEYDEGIRFNQKSSAAYIRRGYTSYRLGQYNRASDDYDSAMDNSHNLFKLYEKHNFPYFMVNEKNKKTSGKMKTGDLLSSAVCQLYRKISESNKGSVTSNCTIVYDPK